jgi:hypothetical protein
MPTYSLFAPYGHQAYSSRPTVVRRIYDSRVTADGGAYTYEGPHGAWAYALARVVGGAQAHLRLAQNQQDPRRASVLLDQLETDWGLTRITGATDQERRDRLTSARQLGWGARLNAVTTGLMERLGDAFLGIRTLESDEDVNIPGDNWSDCSSRFAPLTEPRKVVRFDDDISVLGSTVSINYEVIGGGGQDLALQYGEGLSVESGRWGMAERVIVQGATTTHATILFQRPHEAPFFATTSSVPAWSSTRRHILIVVTEATLSDGELLAAINSYLSDVLPATCTWLITFQQTPGQLGPFTVDEGLIGITPLGTLTFTG